MLPHSTSQIQPGIQLISTALTEVRKNDMAWELSCGLAWLPDTALVGNYNQDGTISPH